MRRALFMVTPRLEMLHSISDTRSRGLLFMRKMPEWRHPRHSGCRLRILGHMWFWSWSRRRASRLVRFRSCGRGTLRRFPRTGPCSACLLIQWRIRSICAPDTAAETRNELVQFANLIIQVGFEARPFNRMVRRSCPGSVTCAIGLKSLGRPVPVPSRSARN